MIAMANPNSSIAVLGRSQIVANTCLRTSSSRSASVQEDHG